MIYEDLFGKILLDQLEKLNDVVYYVERDDGFIEHRSANRYFEGVEKWSEEEKSILNNVGETVLDIGCGAGRTSLYLQNLGKIVTSLDNSPLAISVCEKRGLRNCIIKSMFELDMEEKYSTILLLGANLALTKTPEGMIKFLSSLKMITDEKSNIIFDHRSPLETNNPIHKQYHHKNVQNNKPVGMLKFRIRYLNLKSDWIEFYIPTDRELKDILEKSGWKIGLIDKGYKLLIKQI